jgi:chitinase
MDRNPIDRLALALAEPIARGSRRRTVQWLTAVIAGGALPALTREDLAAKNSGQGHKHPGLSAEKKRKKKRKRKPKHGGGGAAPQPKPVPAGPRKVIGYYVGYERDDMPPDEIEWDAMTHIAVGTVLPRSNGSLNFTLDLGSETKGKALARDLARRARDNGVVPLLMIGGAGAHDGFKQAASGSLNTFVKNLVGAIDDLGYAGLDLDWEPMNRDDEKPFKNLVFALRNALSDAVLTVPADPININFPDVPGVYAQVAPFVDLISVMTYNMEGAYEGWKSWHSSALHGATENTPTAVDASVGAFLDSGVPANKLGVGVGFFGDCWSAPVTGPGQTIGGADIVATDSDMSFITITRGGFYVPAYLNRDNIAKVPYFSYPNPMGDEGCTYITYEDATSIAEKGQWARSQGLNGAIVWTINQGHDPSALAGQKDALLRATRQAFGA